MWYLGLLWPLSGILILRCITPYWMRVSDPVGFAIIHVMALIAGPCLIVIALIYPRTPRDDRWDAEERAKRKRDKCS